MIFIAINTHGKIFRIFQELDFSVFETYVNFVVFNFLNNFCLLKKKLYGFTKIFAIDLYSKNNFPVNFFS